MKKEFVWLIAEYFNPILKCRILRAFLGLSMKIGIGGHPSP
jgi:hypothetical protein